MAEAHTLTGLSLEGCYVPLPKLVTFGKSGNLLSCVCVESGDKLKV